MDAPRVVQRALDRFRGHQARPSDNTLRNWLQKKLFSMDQHTSCILNRSFRAVSSTDTLPNPMLTALH